MSDLQQTLKQLQDTLTVVIGIQARQAEIAKGHSQWLEEQQTAIIRHEQAVARHDQIMAEIDDKLNGLIGFMDGQFRKPE